MPDDPRPRTFAAFSLAAAYSFAGDFEAASAAFDAAAELGLAAGHDYLALEAMGYHAELQMARGRLREADGILRWALVFAVERGDDSLRAMLRSGDHIRQRRVEFGREARRKEGKGTGRSMMVAPPAV